MGLTAVNHKHFGGQMASSLASDKSLRIGSNIWQSFNASDSSVKLMRGGSRSSVDCVPEPEEDGITS
jgi:hypothetical protein